jgi:hypothetical protein
LYKKYQKKLKSKNVKSSTKLYLRALGLSTTPGPKIIFIILIIILNLYDSSLSEFSCNIQSGALDMSMVATSCYKSVIIKREKNYYYRMKLKKKD